MSKEHPPLTVRDVRRVLVALGFERRPGTGTSHEHWTKFDGGRIFKVTVDPPKAPFTHDLVRWMARQAGVSRTEFYEISKRTQG